MKNNNNYNFYLLCILLLMLLASSAYANEVITPLPLNADYDKKKAHVGKSLFFDTILSKDRTVSCNSCHDLKSGGDDNRKEIGRAHV